MKRTRWPAFIKRFWRVKVLGWCGVIIAGASLLIIFLNTFVFLPHPKPEFGVSFSQKRSLEYDLDWRSNYLALLDDLQIRNYRLMSYWDLHEPGRGQFDFTDLDWQMAEAAKRGATVSLAIGIRQPRWPECHEPGWAHKLGGHEWKQALYAYMEIVVNRYKDHPALASWQLENEGMNNWFGTCPIADRQRLIEEFALVKKLDKTNPIYMSLSDQHGLPLGEPTPDVYGFSMYRLLWNEKIPPQGYITYPTPIWYHRLRAAVIKLTKQRDVFVHELQMEPWGPRDNKQLSIEEQNKSMSQKQLGEVVLFARKSGIQKIDVWGSEWWYWRKVNGDPHIWEEVRKQLLLEKR